MDLCASNNVAGLDGGGIDLFIQSRWISGVLVNMSNVNLTGNEVGDNGEWFTWNALARPQ